MNYPFGQLPCCNPSHPFVHPHPIGNWGGVLGEAALVLCEHSTTNTKHGTPGASVAKSSPHQTRAGRRHSSTLAPASFSLGKIIQKQFGSYWERTLSTAEANFPDGQSGLLSCLMSTHRLASKLKNKQKTKPSKWLPLLLGMWYIGYSISLLKGDPDSSGVSAYRRTHV